MVENYLKVKNKVYIKMKRRREVELDLSRYENINNYVNSLMTEKKMVLLNEEDEMGGQDDVFNDGVDLENIAIDTDVKTDVVEEVENDTLGDLETKEVVTISVDDLVDKIHNVLLKLKQIDNTIDIKTKAIENNITTLITNNNQILLRDIKASLDVKIPDNRQKQEMVSLKTPYSINNTDVFNSEGNQHIIQMKTTPKPQVPQTPNDIRKSFYR
jgi:hypothetical protein